MNIILFIIIGALAGWIAGEIMRGEGYGLLVNIIIGIIGALIGGLVLGLFNINLGGIIGELITATLGAIILLWLVGLVNR